MYSSERGSGFGWKDIITKTIFIALFIFLLLWLFPKVPNMTAFYSNVFRENINYMREAAKSYYTNERLPKNIGDMQEMTLQDMIDKNLIVPFVDKDGKSCDTYNSYVQVTKQETEYSLKINLVCESESNYVIETLGCYDYCDDCNKTAIEYQFRQKVESNKTVYTCPSGYSLKDKKCYQTSTTKKIAATKVYTGGEKIVVNALKTSDSIKKVYTSKRDVTTDRNYYCTKGEPYSGSGSSLVCKYEVSKTDCPSGFDYNYSTKRCEYKAKSNYKDESSTKTYYVYDSCSSTSTKKCTYLGMVTLTDCGVKCPRVAKKYKVTETTTKSVFSHYSCPYGGTKSGSICYKKATCPTGYTEYSNGKCYKKGERSYDVIKTESCPYGYNPEGSGSSLKCYTEDIINGEYYCENENAVLNKSKKTCTYYTDKKLTGYDCPTGYTKNGDSCYIYSTKSVNATESIKTTTSYNYKWSTSNTLEGWEKTGKTRNISSI